MRKERIKDYTVEEIERFTEMEKVMERLNKEYANSGVMADKLPYSPQEVAELSVYQQIVLFENAKSVLSNQKIVSDE